jgi:diadenosine tetraphosphate (Ap4A) HIT family hydrolase
MTRREHGAVFDLSRVVGRRLRDQDGRIEGSNFGTNAGKAAGQSVMHCHYHLIPRRQGDHPDPRGGVRGVISSSIARRIHWLSKASGSDPWKA